MYEKKIFITGFSSKNRLAKTKISNNFLKQKDHSLLPKLKTGELVEEVIKKNKNLYFSDEDDIELFQGEDDIHLPYSMPTVTRVGVQGYKTFFGKFKFLDKVQKNPPIRNSATLKYLRTLDSLKHIPEPMGIVKRYGDTSEINIE